MKADDQIGLSIARADVLHGLGYYPASAQERIFIESLLTTNKNQPANAKAIWQTLLKMPVEQLQAERMISVVDETFQLGHWHGGNTDWNECVECCYQSRTSKSSCEQNCLPLSETSSRGRPCFEKNFSKNCITVPAVTLETNITSRYLQ